MIIEPKHSRIIVIDDEPEVVDSILSMLEFKGHHAEGETDSQVFLQRIEKETFDIVISDFRMPVVTGLDIAREVQQKMPDCDVIIVTAFGTMEIAIEALRYDVYDFLIKPFKLEELYHVIDRAFEKQRLKRENKQLREERDRHLKELTTLYEINEIVMESRSLDEVVNFACDTMKESLGITSGTILLEEAEKGIYLARKSFGQLSKPAYNFEIDMNSLEIAALIKKAEITELSGESLRNALLIDVPGEAENEILFTFPMKVGTEFLGFVAVLSTDEDEFAGESKRGLMSVLANQISPLIQLIRLSEKSSHDSEGTIDGIRSMVEHSISKVEAYHGTISFLNCRLMSPGKEGVPGKIFNSVKKSFQVLLESKLRSSEDLAQIGVDGYLLALYGKSKIDSELLAIDLKNQLNSVLSESESEAVVLDVKTFSYPEDGEEAGDIVNVILEDYTSSRDSAQIEHNE